MILCPCCQLFIIISFSRLFISHLLYFVNFILFFFEKGAIIQSTLTEEQSITHAALLSQLTEKASNFVNILDENDELTFLRIRSKNKEVMVAPDKQFLLVVIQNPHISD